MIGICVHLDGEEEEERDLVPGSPHVIDTRLVLAKGVEFQFRRDSTSNETSKSEKRNHHDIRPSCIYFTGKLAFKHLSRRQGSVDNRRRILCGCTFKVRVTPRCPELLLRIFLRLSRTSLSLPGNQGTWHSMKLMSLSKDKWADNPGLRNIQMTITSFKYDSLHLLRTNQRQKEPPVLGHPIPSSIQPIYWSQNGPRLITLSSTNSRSMPITSYSLLKSLKDRQTCLKEMTWKPHILVFKPTKNKAKICLPFSTQENSLARVNHIAISNSCHWSQCNKALMKANAGHC